MDEAEESRKAAGLARTTGKQAGVTMAIWIRQRLVGAWAVLLAAARNPSGLSPVTRLKAAAKYWLEPKLS